MGSQDRVKDEELEAGDWGVDDGYTRAYKDGLPVSAQNVQPTGDATETGEDAEPEEAYPDLSESTGAHLHDLLLTERNLSAQRRTLHARIDFIRTQGSSSNIVAHQLAHLMQKERALSDQRARLHDEIDQLRAVKHARTPRTDRPH